MKKLKNRKPKIENKKKNVFVSALCMCTGAGIFCACVLGMCTGADIFCACVLCMCIDAIIFIDSFFRLLKQ